jgi:hypothetical protein
MTQQDLGLTWKIEENKNLDKSDNGYSWDFCNKINLKSLKLFENKMEEEEVFILKKNK